MLTVIIPAATSRNEAGVEGAGVEGVGGAAPGADARPSGRTDARLGGRRGDDAGELPAERAVEGLGGVDRGGKGGGKAIFTVRVRAFLDPRPDRTSGRSGWRIWRRFPL